MRVLFVLEKYPPYIGGVETLFQSLVTQLKSQGHQVAVITTHHPLRDPSLFPEVISIPITSRILFGLFAFPYVLKEASHYEIIHTSSFSAGYPAYFAAKWRAIPCIITFHELWDQLWKQIPGMNVFQRWIFRNYEKTLANLSFNRIVAVSEFTKTSLHQAGIPLNRIERIYNGVLSSSFPAIKNIVTNNKVFTVLFYGRPGVSKGLDILIDAAQLLEKDRRRDIKIIIISDFESTRYGMSLLRYVKRAPTIIEIKPTLTSSGLISEISKCDAVVIPSYSEGFCFAAVEACMMHKPIIHSSKGALPEVIWGRNIPYHNQNPIELKEAILKGFRGEWDIVSKKSFELSEMTDKYIKLYQKIIT